MSAAGSAETVSGPLRIMPDRCQLLWRYYIDHGEGNVEYKDEPTDVFSELAHSLPIDSPDSAMAREPIPPIVSEEPCLIESEYEDPLWHGEKSLLVFWNTKGLEKNDWHTHGTCALQTDITVITHLGYEPITEAAVYRAHHFKGTVSRTEQGVPTVDAVSIEDNNFAHDLTFDANPMEDSIYATGHQTNIVISADCFESPKRLRVREVENNPDKRTNRVGCGTMIDGQTIIPVFVAIPEAVSDIDDAATPKKYQVTRLVPLYSPA